MRDRLETLDSFRQAVASLALPAGDEELAALWKMVRDLYEQADELRGFIGEIAGEEAAGSSLLTGPRLPSGR